jgi:hypothetical protein
VLAQHVKLFGRELLTPVIVLMCHPRIVMYEN